MPTLPVCPSPTKTSETLSASLPTPPSPALHPSLTLAARLYRDHRAFVLRAAHRLGAPSRDLEDVLHEVFITVHDRAATFRVTDDPRPWLYVITSFVVLNHRNRAWHQRELLSGDLPDIPLGSATPESELEEAELRRDLSRRIALLRPKLREAVVKFVLEERPLAEIAAALKVSAKTAQARLGLGRAELLRQKRARPFRRA